VVLFFSSIPKAVICRRGKWASEVAFSRPLNGTGTLAPVLWVAHVL
jgi:hypothetical protein